MNSKKAETLVNWFLRLNGYFIVENFIVHAGDDPQRISKGVVGNYAEVDTLGIRNKYSREHTGELHIANDELLVNSNASLDFLIAEVKTGKEDKPNKLWREKNVAAISYLIRFAGFIKEDADIQAVANILADQKYYVHPENLYSISLIVFSEEQLNKNWKQLKNIRLDHIVDFLVKVRGECWIETVIGIASIHYQWNELINRLFKIANDFSIDAKERKEQILFELNSE